MTLMLMVFVAVWLIAGVLAFGWAQAFTNGLWHQNAMHPNGAPRGMAIVLGLLGPFGLVGSMGVALLFPPLYTNTYKWTLHRQTQREAQNAITRAED